MNPTVTGPHNYGKSRIENLSFAEIVKVQSEIPSRCHVHDQNVYFVPDGIAVEYLVEYFGDRINFECQTCKDYLLSKDVKQKNIEIKKSNEVSLTEFDYDFKTVPYNHQKKALELSRDLPYFAFFMEMGSGKTKTTIDNAGWLFEKGKIDTLLVLAPNNVHIQWVVDEIPKHLPERINYKAGAYSSTMKAKEKRILEELMKPDENAFRILAVNIEAMSRKSGLEICEKFLKTSCKRMIALDEGTRIKQPTSSRTKNCMKLVQHSEYRRLLTGSPVTNGVENLYSQLTWLSPNILGIKTYTAFKNRYCVMRSLKGTHIQFITGYKLLDDLKDRMDPWVFRVTKAECLDLPEKIYQTRIVDMTSEQSKIYQKLKEELLVMFENGEAISVDDDITPKDLSETKIASAQLAIVQLMKLQQITSGFLFEDDTKKIAWKLEAKNNPKIQEILNIMEQSNGKVIIWARFVHDIKLLHEALKKKYSCVLYYGGSTPEEKQNAIKEFVKGEARVFIANPASAGIGLNLNVASEVIYFSNSFNAEHRWQSEDRAHRIGMKGTVTYYDLVSNGSIDEKIKQALQNKKDLSDMTIDDVKNLIL